MIFRSIIFTIIFYSSILFFGLFFLPSLISRKLATYVVKIWAKIIILSLKHVIGIKIQFLNSFIKNNKGYLIAANHQSVFDTIFFLTTFDKVIYIVKKELKYVPVYGWYAARLGHIFLDRKEKIKSMKKLTKNIKNLINQGYKVIIFPEGTRQQPNTLGEMKPGIFAMQSAIKSKVYPVYFKSGLTWPKKGLKKNKSNIFISSLLPLENATNKKDFLKNLQQSFLKADKDLKIIIK